MSLQNVYLWTVLLASLYRGSAWQLFEPPRQELPGQQAAAGHRGGLSAEFVLKTMKVSFPAQAVSRDDVFVEEEAGLEPLVPSARFLKTCEALFVNPDSRDIGFAVQELRTVAALLEQQMGSSQPFRELLPAKTDPVDIEAVPPPENDPADFEHHEPLVAAGSMVYMLAAMLASGLGRPWLQPNDTAAMQLEHLAARAGSQSAQLALMDRYADGRGVPQSCAEAFRRGRQVAEALADDLDGSGAEEAPQVAPYLRQRWRDASYITMVPSGDMPGSDLGLGRAFEADGLLGIWGSAWTVLEAAQLDADPVAAVDALRVAALDGDPDALSALGHMHMRGKHLPRNATRARVLLISAAELGSASAHNALGVMHLQGLGMPVNYTRARKMFEIGASMGEPDCFFNLAVLHMGGLGVDTDDDMALHYLQEAHDFGHWKAPYQIALLLHEGTTSTRANCTAAFKHLYTFLTERSAWAVDIQAAIDDLDAGDEWAAVVQMAVAAEQGSSLAEANLAWLLTRGVGYNASDRHERALEMHLRAGMHSVMPGELVDAGLLLFDGGSTLRSGGNKSEAWELWWRAAERKDVEAWYLLGWVAETGALGSRNLTLARDLYERAVGWSAEESEALAPFLALWKVRLKLFGVAAADLAAAFARAPGLGLLVSAVWDLLARLSGPLASSMKLAARAASLALQWETSMLTLLCCGLATVLWWRHRRRTQLPSAAPDD